MKRAYCKYIFSLLLFGTNGIVASGISLTSYEIVLFRTLIGAVLLFIVFRLTGGKSGLSAGETAADISDDIRRGDGGKLDVPI